MLVIIHRRRLARGDRGEQSLRTMNCVRLMVLIMRRKGRDRLRRVQVTRHLDAAQRRRRARPRGTNDLEGRGENRSRRFIVRNQLITATEWSPPGPLWASLGCHRTAKMMMITIGPAEWLIGDTTGSPTLPHGPHSCEEIVPSFLQIAPLQISVDERYITCRHFEIGDDRSSPRLTGTSTYTCKEWRPRRSRSRDWWVWFPRHHYPSLTTNRNYYRWRRRRRRPKSIGIVEWGWRFSKSIIQGRSSGYIEF